MRLMALVFALLFVPGVLMCQEVEGGQVSILPFPLPVNDQLKSYLNLTDGQIAGLQQVQTRKHEAEKKLYDEIGEKSRTLSGLLQNNSTDAARIGQLMIDIQRLQKQVPVQGEPYRSQSLAVLSQEQRSKLPALVQAMQLQQAAWQAVNFNLIDSPQMGPRPVPLPMPVFPAMQHTAVTSGLFQAIETANPVRE
ncbi:MAG: hypothetical protein JNL98_20370 [Bryobacterales bacterium]|nr:hypothetical protein [Bryobacterales bacterium]